MRTLGASVPFFRTSSINSSPTPMKASYKPLETSNPSNEEEEEEEEVISVIEEVQPGQTVAIVAPADLPGGYEFTAVVDDRDVIVAVPDEGIQKGERFNATVTAVLQGRSPNGVPCCSDTIHTTVDNADDSYSIIHVHAPIGEWRDSLCDCCVFGCCHPVLCLTFWCPPLSLGQVMHRTGLDWTASPVDHDHHHQPLCSPCVVLAWMYIPFLMLISLLILSEYSYMNEASGRYQELPEEFFLIRRLRILLSLLWAIFFITILSRTRSHVRQRYGIPEDPFCRGCEDCCCSCFCGKCTICQLARHTADFHRHPAACCTENGLSGSAPAANAV